jgi:NAD(P)H dehydrogenase (quinone)
MDKVTEVAAKVGLGLAGVGEALGLKNLDPTSGTIFITGGTGVLGYRVATRLLGAAYPTVRIGAHDNADLVEKLNGEGAQLADFNWDNEATYAHALKGVKSVFCTAPYVQDWEEKFPLFLQACEDAGVKHFVKLSFYHARSSEALKFIPFIKAHGECDNMLVKSGLSYTILGASHFMSNPLVSQGMELRADRSPAAMFGASNGKGVNYVSPNDVAEVAVRVLLEPKPHRNKEYTLTGPYAITDQLVSTLLSRHLNKPIIFVDQPLHAFEEGEKAGGDPEWLVKDLVGFEQLKGSGLEENRSFVSHDVEEVCGHKAESYESYLMHKEKMTPAEVV